MKPRKCNSYKDGFVIYKAYLRKNEVWEPLPLHSPFCSFIILIKSSTLHIITTLAKYNEMCKVHNKRLIAPIGNHTDILDKVERRYIRNIIKPFRDRVKVLVKTKTYMNNEMECINIIYDNNSVMTLPSFKSSTMYSNMELNTLYTPKTLKL